MRLYELTEAYKSIWELVTDEDVDLEALEMALNQVEEDINQKAENMAKLVKSIEADVEVIKAEEQRLSTRRKALENKKDNMKQYLEMQLNTAKIEKIKTPVFTIAIQNNPPSVELVDENLIPQSYKSYEVKIDKKSILSALKEGQAIPGADIKRTKSLRIR